MTLVDSFTEISGDIYFDKQLYEINFSNICAVLCSLNVRYYTIPQIIVYNYCNIEIPNTIAEQTQKFFRLYPGAKIYNSYIKHKLAQNIIGQNLESQIPFDNFLIKSNEIGYHLAKYYLPIYKFLLAVQLSSSSFFLSDLLNYFPILSQYYFNKDIFFDSIDDCKQFCREAQITLPTLYKLSTKESCAYYYKLHFWKPFIPNFRISVNNNIFVKRATVYSEEFNTDQYFLSKYDLKILPETERMVNLPIENFGDSMFFYMFHVLKLSNKSLSSLMVQRAYEFLIEKKNTTLLPLKTLNFLKTLDILCIEKTLFYRNIPIFFSYTQYHINKIQSFMRKNKILNAYILNLKKLEIQPIKLRSIMTESRLKFVY